MAARHTRQHRAAAAELVPRPAERLRPVGRSRTRQARAVMISGLSHPASTGGLVPALPSSILEPLGVQVAALLPDRQVHHPLGCHRPRIPDRLVFDKLIQILVFGCGYRRIRRRHLFGDHPAPPPGRADQCRRGRAAAPAGAGAYDRLFGLELEQLAVDSCPTKAPCGGQVAGPSRWTGASRASSARRSPRRVGIRLGAVPAPGQPPRRRAPGGDVGHPHRGRAVARPAGGAPCCRP
jgi:hypothetical protein